MPVQYMETLQDLEEEIAKQKAFIGKFTKNHENLVLQTIELIKEVRNCDTIVIKNESEQYLLDSYCSVATAEYGEAVLRIDIRQHSQYHLVNTNGM